MLLQLALPKYKNTPAHRAQFFVIVFIAFAIAGNLLFPESRIACGHGSAFAGVPMPKTTVNKDDRSVFRQHNVRPAGKGFSMQPEAITHPMQKTADRQLRSGVLPMNSRHDGATLGRSKNVGHLAEFRSFSTHPATAEARRGGTALPICFAIWIFEPQNTKSSGNV